jgi:Uncharacterized conserved protein (DUF2203)
MPEDTPSDGTPTWTEGEARAYLPRLRGLLAVLRRATDLAVRSRGNGHSDLEDRGSVGSQSSRFEVAHRALSAAEDLPWGVSPRQALEELSARGIILRDASRGLVDFPSRRRSGRVVFLCWQLGEDDLAWWHLPEDGFPGRRPLPVPPEI